MPVRYTLFYGICRVDLEGEYEPKDIVQAYLDATADPDFPEVPKFLFDVTKSKEFSKRDPETIRNIAHYLGERSKDGEQCAIVAEKEVHYGLSRMAAAMAEMGGSEVQVFSTVKEAMAWLHNGEKD